MISKTSLAVLVPLMLTKGGKMMENNKRGTKAVFTSWLLANKRLTYTKYTKLSPEAKREIQNEYRKGQKQ